VSTDRQLVRRVLALFMEDLQATFRRRAAGRCKPFLRANPPCHSCAFNSATNGARGFESTANNVRAALAERRPFFCHQGFPWRKRITRWTPAEIRRFFVHRRFCSGWGGGVGAPRSATAFERAAIRACREAGRRRLA
jgi:hypothetical protein